MIIAEVDFNTKLSELLLIENMHPTNRSYNDTIFNYTIQNSLAKLQMQKQKTICFNKEK